MKMYVLDYPLVRRSAQCPMCHDTKHSGCVVCWSCHNITEFGTPEQRAIRETAIEAVEAQLAEHDTERMRAFA